LVSSIDKEAPNSSSGGEIVTNEYTRCTSVFVMIYQVYVLQPTSQIKAP